MNIKKILISSILILISYSFAQGFTGKYILQESGLVLVLEQQEDNRVLGLLTGPDASFELEGQLSPDDTNTAYGYIYTGESNLLFAIVLEEETINMIAFAILENGDPNPDDSETFIFIRENANQANNQTTDTNTNTNPNRLPSNNQPLNSNPNTNTTDSQTTNPQQNPLSQTTTTSNAPSSQNPLANKDPFLGLFIGEGLSLELAKDNDSFIGKIEFDGNSFPLVAKKDGAMLIGNFKVGDNIFSFSAAISQDIVSFVTDGASYSLKRQ